MSVSHLRAGINLAHILVLHKSQRRDDRHLVRHANRPSKVRTIDAEYAEDAGEPHQRHHAGNYRR